MIGSQAVGAPHGPPPPFNPAVQHAHPHPHPHQQQLQSQPAQQHNFVGNMEQHPMDSSDSFVPLMESDDSGPE